MALRAGVRGWCTQVRTRRFQAEAAGTALCRFSGMAARLLRQPSCRVECVEDSIRVVFAFLDIGLVERVNAEYMSRYGRCKLPPEEFRTDIIAITEIELENRLIRL